MGKKKGSRKQGSQAGDTDAASIASVTTLSSVADLGFDDSSSIDDDPFEVSIDCLYEKRASIRERGLQNLVGLLAKSFSYEEALVRKETLSSLMLGRIRKGSALESSLACRGIALLVVTLGAGGDADSEMRNQTSSQQPAKGKQQEAQPALEQAACHGKGVSVKAAAIEALAVTTFVACNDPAVVDKCMAGFANLWKSGPVKVSSAAIRGWSLLLSTLPAWRMTTSSVESWLQGLAKQLHSEDVEVRAAAGEAIALLYHSCGISDLESWLEDQEQSDPDLTPPGSPTSISSQTPQGLTRIPSSPPQITLDPTQISQDEHQINHQGNEQPSKPVSADIRDQSHINPESDEQSSAAASAAASAGLRNASQGDSPESIQAPPVLSPEPESDIHTESTQAASVLSPEPESDAETSQLHHSHQQRLQHNDNSHELSSQPSTAIDQNQLRQNETGSQSERESAESDAMQHSVGLQLGSNHQMPSTSLAGVSGDAAESQQGTRHSNSSTADSAAKLAPKKESGQVQIQNQDADATQAGVGHHDRSHHSVSLPSEQAMAGGINSQLPAKSKGGTQAKHQTGSRDPKQQAEAISSGLDDVVSRMKELATNRGDRNRRSRKDRASMRSTFRELCNVVEQDGSVAQTKIKLRHGDILVIDTLVGTIQLNALRRLLAEGFQAHLQSNPLLHQIFEFEPRAERPEKLSALEKKMYRSPASAESKSRTQQRNHDRANAKAYKGAMMAEDW